DARTARCVIKLYALRMKIEEGIRDTKNPRWGFALCYARSRRAERLELLLLVAALATLVCWLAGLAVEALQWDRHFQANTERKRAVLSTVFLGREVFARPHLCPRRLALLHAARRLPRLVADCASAL